MQRINRRVYIRVTNKCNRNCSFCYYKNDPKELGDITLDTIKEIISKELDIHKDLEKPLRVELTGGEPTLCKNLTEIVKYLNNLPKVWLLLETNGTNLDSKEFLDLIENFKDSSSVLKISINSELLDYDTNWIKKVATFVHYAKENNIKYFLNIRIKDETDKTKIKQAILNNNLQPPINNPKSKILYYSINEINLYRDGWLPTYGSASVLYDFDGSILFTVEG